MGGEWEVNGRWMGGGWEVDVRWMGGGPRRIPRLAFTVQLRTHRAGPGGLLDTS